MNVRIVNRLAALAGIVLLSACASGGGTLADRSAPDPDYLAKRALERWNLLISGRGDLAYDYLSPGSRELKSRQAYLSELASRPVKWLAAESGEVKCEDSAEFCDVVVNVRFRVPSSLPTVGKLESVSPVTERWIRSGKDWYLVPKDVARR